MTTEKKGRVIFCGILTVSDSCSSGKKTDQSGPILQKVLSEFKGFRAVVKVKKIVPDEAKAIKETLLAWSDQDGIDFIVTTGGTGFSPRDITPEVTLEVIEREALGIVIGLVAASIAVTPFGLLSRMRCGIRGKSLILNLPGSKKGAEECLKYVLPVVDHAIALIQDDLESVSDYHKSRIPSDDKSSGYGSEQSITGLSPPSHVFMGHHAAGGHAGLRGGHGLASRHHVVNSGLYSDPHSLHSRVPPIDGHTVDAHGLADGSQMQTLTEEDLNLDNLEKEVDAELEAMIEESTTSSSPTILNGAGVNSAKKAVIRKADKDEEGAIPQKVARRERKSSYPLLQMSEATRIVMENTHPLPVVEKSYRGLMLFLNRFQSEKYELLRAEI